MPDLLQLSPSEGEEDEWIRQSSSLSQMVLTPESSQQEKQEDPKLHPPDADNDKTKATATPATPPSTRAETGSPTMKRSSSGTRLQRKRPPRLTLSKDGLGGGSKAEQGAGAFGDCLDFCKENLFRGHGGEAEGEEEEEVVVPQEKIMHRINSKMAHRSYQLGKQLSSRWTTGAGPRIGCVRDYPPELQFRSLEQVSLSPRGGGGMPRIGGGTPGRQSPSCAPPFTRTASPLGAAGTPT